MQSSTPHASQPGVRQVAIWMMMMMVCLGAELNGLPIVDVLGCHEALGELLVPHFLALLFGLSVVGPTWLVASWPVDFLNPGMETSVTATPMPAQSCSGKGIIAQEGIYLFIY